MRPTLPCQNRHCKLATQGHFPLIISDDDGAAEREAPRPVPQAPAGGEGG